MYYCMHKLLDRNSSEVSCERCTKGVRPRWRPRIAVVMFFQDVRFKLPGLLLCQVCVVSHFCGSGSLWSCPRGFHPREALDDLDHRIARRHFKLEFFLVHVFRRFCTALIMIVWSNATP